jgi:hypothetical protein
MRRASMATLLGMLALALVPSGTSAKLKVTQANAERAVRSVLRNNFAIRKGTLQVTCARPRGNKARCIATFRQRKRTCGGKLTVLPATGPHRGEFYVKGLEHLRCS